MLFLRMLMNLTLCVQILMNLINYGIVYIRADADEPREPLTWACRC